MLITAYTIIEARKKVQEASALNPIDFVAGLLGSHGVTAAMVKEWVPGAILRVEWCACDPCPDPKAIQCAACGLPPYWSEEVEDE